MALNTVVYDSFTGAEGTSLDNHLGETGSAWVDAYDWSISDGPWYLTGTGAVSPMTPGRHIMVVESGSLLGQEFELRARITVSPQHAYDTAVVGIGSCSVGGNPYMEADGLPCGIRLRSMGDNVPPAGREVWVECGISQFPQFGDFTEFTGLVGSQSFDVSVRKTRGGDGPGGWMLRYYLNGVLVFEDKDPEVVVQLGEFEGEVTYESFGIHGSGASSIDWVELLVEDGITPQPDAFWTNIIRAAETP